MTRRSLIAVMVVAGSLSAFLSTAAPVSSQSSGRAWLALGDSYSSGEGIPGTVDVGPAQQHQGRNCQRATGDGTSATAWSVSAYNAVAGDLGFEDMAFVACTGAVTNELASQIGEAQERTGRRKWDVVTLSLGGNDIGFADVLLGCLDANSLPWGAFDLTPGCDVDEPTLRSRVDQLRSSLGSAYDLVASKVTPGGDVVVAGYPHLIEEVARWDRWRRGAIGNCEGIQSYDVGLLRSVTGYLNQQIALAVADADARHQGSGVRFHFLDISLDPYEYSDDPGARHALCSRDPWLNGQTTGVSDGDFRLDRSFHPTQVGHDNTGRVLATFLRDSVTFADAPAAPTTTHGSGDDLEVILERIVAAWVSGDLTLGGHAAPDIRIEPPWDGYEYDLGYDREYCELGSSGSGGCFIFGDDGSEGYAPYWNFLYHEGPGGEIVVDQLLFESTAG